MGGVSIFLPSIPEQERFPASPAASWQEGAEHLNLQCPEEEFSVSWVPAARRGEQQPWPPRQAAIRGSLCGEFVPHSPPLCAPRG